MAKLFIKNGADLHMKDKNGASLIFYAFNIDLIDLYITNGLDINDVNNDGHTSFYYYSTLKNKDRINLLINAGINLNIKSKDGSILDFINQYYNDDTSLPKLFIDHGAIASKIKTYYAHRNLFTQKQQKVFDIFASITSMDDDFFAMCLAYQNDQKNNVKINLTDMNII